MRKMLLASAAIMAASSAQAAVEYDFVTTSTSGLVDIVVPYPGPDMRLSVSDAAFRVGAWKACYGVTDAFGELRPGCSYTLDERGFLRSLFANFTTFGIPRPDHAPPLGSLAYAFDLVFTPTTLEGSIYVASASMLLSETSDASGHGSGSGYSQADDGYGGGFSGYWVRGGDPPAAAAIPEPRSLFVLLAGLALLACFRPRPRRS